MSDYSDEEFENDENVAVSTDNSTYKFSKKTNHTSHPSSNSKDEAIEPRKPAKPPANDGKKERPTQRVISNSSIPSSIVPVSGKEKKKKKKAEKKRIKKEKKRAKKERKARKIEEDEEKFESRIWNESAEGYRNGRSRFRMSCDQMREKDFGEGESMGGTRVGSSLMHTAYAGDAHIDDLDRVLNPSKKKKEGRKSSGGHDSNSEDSDTREDLEYGMEVIASVTSRAEQAWKCDIKETDASGWTALHYAASKGHSDVIRRLIKMAGNSDGIEGDGGEENNGNDDDVSYVDFQDTLMGWTPLHLSCVELHTDAIVALLESGANPTIGDDVGDRPIDVISKKPKMSKKRAKIRKLLKDAMRENWGNEDVWGVSSDEDDYGSATDEETTSEEEEEGREESEEDSDNDNDNDNDNESNRNDSDYSESD